MEKLGKSGGGTCLVVLVLGGDDDGVRQPGECCEVWPVPDTEPLLQAVLGPHLLPSVGDRLGHPEDLEPGGEVQGEGGVILSSFPAANNNCRHLAHCRAISGVPGLLQVEGGSLLVSLLGSRPVSHLVVISFEQKGIMGFMLSSYKIKHTVLTVYRYEAELCFKIVVLLLHNTHTFFLTPEVLISLCFSPSPSDKKSNWSVSRG